MRERDIEKKLVERVRKAGGIAYKFTSPQRRNVPDRICVMPKSRIVFVECKPPGGKPTAGQWREIERLRALGFTVLVCDSERSIEESIPLPDSAHADNYGTAE